MPWRCIKISIFVQTDAMCLAAMYMLWPAALKNDAWPVNMGVKIEGAV